VRHFEENAYLLMATRNGLIKKTELAEYSRPRQGGVIGISLEDGDTLIDVALVRAGDEVVLSSRNGMAIRFSEADARPMGRNTKGVRGIKLVGDDEVVGMVVADPEGQLLTVCENGYGKRTPFGAHTADIGEEVDGEADGELEVEPTEPPLSGDANGVAEGEPGEGAEERSSMRYRRQRRGGKGVKDIRTSERNGRVVGVVPVRETDDLMLITLQGMVTRIRASEVRVSGRNTQGVRVITPNEGDKLASVAKVAREEEVAETAGPSTE
jgi:DNA gyrase subunit A